MSVEKASGYRNGSFMASTNGMLLLEEVNMRNNRLARNGDNGNVATLDLSWQGRLKKLDVRGTGLTRVKLATGAPVVQLCLPDTIEELFLEYLTKLSDSGLILEGSIMCGATATPTAPASTGSLCWNACTRPD